MTTAAATRPVGAPPAAAAAAAPRELPLEFRGTARAYFRVWAVNLCLTLITLGVYSAWAKVRKKRYFYSHTVLDGTPFQYLAQPVPILKGRIVAVVLFLIYYVASHFFTVLMPYVLAAGGALAPWVLVRSAAFNARYSAYRNMTFAFDAGYWDAVKAIYVWGLVPVIIVGTAFEWWGQPVYAGAAFGVFGLAFPWWLRRLKNLIVSHTAFGGRNGTLSVTGTQFFKVYFLAGLVVAGAAMLTGFIVAFGVGIGGAKHSPNAVLGGLLPIYVGYVFAFAFIQARISNLVWNHTELGPLRFQSTLKATGLAKLYITNAIAILVSLGLLIPWAVIRTLKYRADHMQVRAEGDLNAFRGDEHSAVQATGAEVGEFFDMDLSL
ncbi:MAG: YjgN family protein [Gammaproteobacteria bacterium]